MISRILNKLFLICISLLIICCTSVDNHQKPDIWKVYFLGGQSNMDGYGYNNKLPDTLKGIIPSAMIFDGNRINDNNPGGGIGIWSPMKAGHGVGFKTDGQSNILSDRFGPELSFASTLATKGARIAIIKYSYGGTALFAGAGYGNWEPDFDHNNHYDNALTTIRNAYAVTDINNDGRPDKLVPAGIIWMQGEADAQFSQASADAYHDNLKRLMDLLRGALRKDDLPVVIGKINDSHMTPDGGPTQPYIATVHAAQKDFTDNDPCATLVTETETYMFSSDVWHYDSDGYIRMGKAFAKAVTMLESTCK